ncbi:hypothetical protein ACE6JH_34440 [Streptomyces nigra]
MACAVGVDQTGRSGEPVVRRDGQFEALVEAAVLVLGGEQHREPAVLQPSQVAYLAALVQEVGHLPGFQVQQKKLSLEVPRAVVASGSDGDEWQVGVGFDGTYGVAGGDDMARTEGAGLVHADPVGEPLAGAAPHDVPEVTGDDDATVRHVLHRPHRPTDLGERLVAE